MSARFDDSSFITDPAADCAEFESIIPTDKTCGVCGKPIMKRQTDSGEVVYFDFTGHRFTLEQL